MGHAGMPHFWTNHPCWPITRNRRHIDDAGGNQIQSVSITFLSFFSWSNPIPIMGYIHLYPIIIFPYYVIYINIPCIMFYIPHDVPIHRMSQARMWNAPSSNMSSAVSRCPVVLAQWCPVVGMDGYPNPVTESDIWMVYIYMCVKHILMDINCFTWWKV